MIALIIFIQSQHDTVLDGLYNSFNKRGFKLVLAMDEVEDPLKDMILNLRQCGTDIVGVEIQRYVIDEEKEVFVPNLIGVEVSASLPTAPIGFKESHYKNGLTSEADKIMTELRKAAESYDFAWVREPLEEESYRYLYLREHLFVYFHINPERDHEVG